MSVGQGNRSSAVMQQRAEAHDSLDHFPTPPWATRALCEKLAAMMPLHLMHAWEPACAEGHMARPLGEYFDQVYASDICDYGYPAMDRQGDFLLPFDLDGPADWIITNPPFKLGCEFIQHALALAEVGVAVFVRSSFVEGQGRYDALFRDCPETFFLPFTERVVLWKGCLLDPDVPITRWHEKKRRYITEKPTTATSYCWLVWIKGDANPGCLRRIPPCRAALTRPGDYPALPDHLRPREGGLLNAMGGGA